MKAIQISGYEDYLELCRMHDRKTYQEANKRLQTARKWAEAWHMIGQHEIATLTLRIASDLFLMEQTSRKMQDMIEGGIV